MNLRLGYISGFFACFLVLLVISCSRQQPKVETVTISNVEPRRDINGQIIDAHSGCLQVFNGRFYLYGRSFGTNQNGTATNLSFTVYSSPDLQQWTYEGKLLKDPPAGVYARSYVVFNPLTQKYVAWYSWFSKLWVGQAGVAVSDNPIGPFTIVNSNVHLLGTRPGDGSVFVDDDGTGYYIYADMDDDYAIRVERLAPDFLSSTGKASDVIAKGNESPVLFRRNNIYYALTSPLCRDCPDGSAVQVFTSLSPLGPFFTKLTSNINLQKTSATPALQGTVTNWPAENGASDHTNASWYIINPKSSIPNIPAQETWVTEIPSVEPAFIWEGDRWGSAPDGFRAHDFQYWIPLDFSEDGQIQPIKMLTEWHITWGSAN